MSQSLPVLTASQPFPNMMTSGPNGLNLAAQAKKGHPLDHSSSQQASQPLQGSHPSTNSAFDFDATRRIYGAGLAMSIRTELDLAANVGGR